LFVYVLFFSLGSIFCRTRCPIDKGSGTNSFSWWLCCYFGRKGW